MDQTYGKWIPLKELGQGGQGTVYLAVQQQEFQEVYNRSSPALREFISPSHTQQEWVLMRNAQEALRSLLDYDSNYTVVALKVLNDPTKKALERSKKEVQVLRDTNHPGLITLVDSDESHEWIAFEYCSGGTLEQHIDRFKGKPLDAVRALCPIAEALQKLHDAGVVHRDIKPGNLFFRSSGDLVLGDCGLAFDADFDQSRITSTSEKVGTREFMPTWIPFGKIDSEHLNPSFDVFGFAKVLWSMIAGDLHLHLHYYDQEQYNLIRRCKHDLNMHHVNEGFLRHYMCQFEKDMSSESFVRCLYNLKRRLEAETRRKCQLCELGRYCGSLTVGNAGSTRIECNRCGHIIDYTGENPQWIQELASDGTLSDPPGKWK